MVVVFFATNLLGDPARLMLRPEAPASQVEALRERLGLNDPLPVRFARYLGGIARGDFGESIWQRAPAMPIVLERLPNTLYLAAATLAIAVPLALLLGFVAAPRPGSATDRVVTTLAVGGVSTADFWLGLMLIVVFAVGLGWLPTSGFGGLNFVLLPALALGARPFGRLCLMVRDALREQLAQNYVAAARARGLRERAVVGRHAMRNAVIPVLTLAGDEAATLLSSAVVIETVFGWPGLGLLLIQAVERRDLPLIISCVVVVATLVVVINLLVDLAYAAADPRVRFA